MPLRRLEKIMKTVEYKVRPVTRYVVTRYESDPANGAGGVCPMGEFDHEAYADRVCAALSTSDMASPPAPIFGAAISQLTVTAETCEHNAPIHASEGNSEQAAHSRAQAASCRAAIGLLQAGRAEFLELALRTPGLSGVRDHINAAKAYSQFLSAT